MVSNGLPFSLSAAIAARPLPDTGLEQVTMLDTSDVERFSAGQQMIEIASVLNNGFALEVTTVTPHGLITSDVAEISGVTSSLGNTRFFLTRHIQI